MRDKLSEIVERYAAGLLEAELPFCWNVRAEIVPARVQVIVEVDDLPLECRERLFRVHSDIVLKYRSWDADFEVRRRDEDD